MRQLLRLNSTLTPEQRVELERYAADADSAKTDELQARLDEPRGGRPTTAVREHIIALRQLCGPHAGWKQLLARARADKLNINVSDRRFATLVSEVAPPTKRTRRKQ